MFMFRSLIRTCTDCVSVSSEAVSEKDVAVDDCGQATTPESSTVFSEL